MIADVAAQAADLVEKQCRIPSREILGELVSKDSAIRGLKVRLAEAEEVLRKPQTPKQRRGVSAGIESLSGMESPDRQQVVNQQQKVYTLIDPG